MDSDGSMAIETNSFETIHLRPRHLRLFHSRRQSFEATFILRHVKAKLF